MQLEPPPLPVTQPPLGSVPGVRSAPMKFTTFHQHQSPGQQHIMHNNGNFNGTNYVQTIQISPPQQNYLTQQQMHHHHQKQFYENNPQLQSQALSYGPNSQVKMSAPLAQTQQRSTAIWHQQQYVGGGHKQGDYNGNAGSANDSG